MDFIYGLTDYGMGAKIKKTLIIRYHRLVI